MRLHLERVLRTALCGHQGPGELLSSLLSLNLCERPTMELARHHHWFDPLQEEAKGEEVTLVQPLGFPWTQRPRSTW